LYETRSVTTLGQPGPHPEVFGGFRRWEGTVPEGFIVNFLGVLTRVTYFEDYADEARKYPADRYVKTEYPAFEEEYFEWVDLLEAVVAAEDHFTMLELGAGFGRWTVNAAAALKHLGRSASTLILVEAEPTHFRWISQHLLDNGIDPATFRLVQAAVAGTDGRVGFYVGETHFGGPASWYGQRIGGSHAVDAVSLNTLLQPLQTVDLIDLDVQGAELEVLEAGAQAVDEKVKRVHIGTHSTQIEEGLRSLFGRLGWKCLHSFPCGKAVDTDWGTISFDDGVQSWLNPTYLSRPRNDLAILSEKLDASRREGARLWQELKSVRQEQQRVHTLDPGSVAWKVLARCGRARDRIAPPGTRRRKMFDFIAKRI
jgi:FkbM family methyltransferase